MRKSSDLKKIAACGKKKDCVSANPHASLKCFSADFVPQRTLKRLKSLAAHDTCGDFYFDDLFTGKWKSNYPGGRTPVFFRRGEKTL
jgi:hypothetical protein